MAISSPRLWWLAMALLLWAPHTHCREFTHEDIREAMLSLVHMIRMSEDKLERHEFREKALGEQVKKMLTGLDKKHRTLEPLKGMISRLDERLSNVETILLQKEEREKASQTKINESLESIQKALMALAPAPAPPADLDNSLSTSGDAVLRRLDATDSKIDAVKKEIKTLKTSLSPESLRSMCLEVASDANPFEKHISDAEKLLNKYELKLNEFNGTKVQTDFVPLNEVSLADEAWHSKMSEVMERQEIEVKKIQRLLSDAESMWKDLPRLADLNRSTNETIDSVNKATETLLINNEMAVTKMETKLREMGDRLVATNEDVQRSLTQSNTMTEHAYNDISRSYETLRNEVQLLSKSEQVILETADNVVATKKRFEYGVNQILMEVGELLKNQQKNMNHTVSKKLDSMETAITSNQTTAMKALSSKVESEMSQVWRQIGIMHKQIMMSSQALNKLSEFSQEFVNASTSTMDKVKKEVGDITTRIVELQSNLNFVLGELSIASQEFRQMASGLTKALNEAKNKNSTTVPTVEDAGPGPHTIASAEKTT
ncbi:putative leucine-rich repeat-containing protein DDB_G0290503 [Helicoverpa zea]|uniref:putative leucine-rich repeat-containing protein DDB_G0290503 n=1 Tax=Helicoverpa zea TaxID=7113 RepID=UPI001F5AB142|nr:putative leucine-rich repeat-containing protein DDB_G0290503 [Helicoverpa zea]